MKTHKSLFKNLAQGAFLLILIIPVALGAQNGPNAFDENIPVNDSEMTVNFPPHYCTGTVQNIRDLSPDNLPEEVGYPEVANVRCGNVSMEHSDKIESMPDGKVRITRKWEVCDPCHNPRCVPGIQIIQSFINPDAYPTNKNANTQTGVFELYQNRPNPFSGQTIIGFTLPEAANITLTVHQADGRVLHVMEGEYSQGFSEVIIESGTLPTEGFLFYTLTTDTHRATKRMVKMN